MFEMVEVNARSLPVDLALHPPVEEHCLQARDRLRSKGDLPGTLGAGALIESIEKS